MQVETLTAPKSIGLVGLGVMGSAIARRLVGLGFPVTGRDVDASAERRAAKSGVTVGSGADLSAVDFLLTSLPDDAAVESALLGVGGLVARLRPGTVIVELSTILPRTVRAVLRAATERGIRVIDCAVSGGPEDAENGTLVLLVGAGLQDLADSSPLLAALGSINHAGEVGDGKTIKLVNNTMTMGNVLIAAEAFSLGLRAGIDPERLFAILAVSGGRSHQFVKRFPNLLKGDFSPRFSVALGEKDLKLALALASSVGATMTATAVITERYSAAGRAGLGTEDIVAVTKLYETLSTHQGT